MGVLFTDVRQSLLLNVISSTHLHESQCLMAVCVVAYYEKVCEFQSLEERCRRLTQRQSRTSCPAANPLPAHRHRPSDTFHKLTAGVGGDET
jgi:hypothetical protein